jgi:hypothetical protein
VAALLDAAGRLVAVAEERDGRVRLGAVFVG